MSSDGNKRGAGADDLIAGILNRAHDVAAEEEQRVQQTLAAREAASLRDAEAEAIERKRQAQESLAQERQRQENAYRRRTQALRALSGETEEVSDEADQPGADHVPPAGYPPQLAQAPSLAKRSSRALVVALVVGVVVTLGGGGTAAFVVLNAPPPIDPNSYPKVHVDTHSVQMSTTALAINLIPVPEPEPEIIVPLEGLAGADAEVVAEREGSRDSGRRSSRGGDSRRRSQAEEGDAAGDTPSGPSFDIDDGGIFSRGSE